MRKPLIHPVFVKKNAVNPRNQKNILTGQDKNRMYRHNDDRQGKTLRDIMSDLKLWKLRKELTDPKAL